MKWNHILESQPEHDALIVQIDAPVEYKGIYDEELTKHYCMGMRKYYSPDPSTWEEFLEWHRVQDIPLPNFWWIYAKDFPFPDSLD